MQTLSLKDYSNYMTNISVAKLAANGCLLAEGERYLLLQMSAENSGQELVGIDAPIESSMEFEIFEIQDGRPKDSVVAFNTTGSPGQCYNHAVLTFTNWLKLPVEPCEHQ